METLEDFNRWLKQIGEIDSRKVSFKIYSLHDKSIRSLNDLYDEDDPAFIFVFSHEDISPFILMLPMSVLQRASEYYRFAMSTLERYKEVTLMNFPHGKIWSRVDDEYVSNIEDYLAVIKDILKESSELLSKEIISESEF